MKDELNKQKQARVLSKVMGIPGREGREGTAVRVEGRSWWEGRDRV